MKKAPHDIISTVIPDGWYPINPPPSLEDPPGRRNAKKNPSHHDPLGLTKATHPANIKVPRINANNTDDSVQARSSPRHRKLQQQQQQHQQQGQRASPRRPISPQAPPPLLLSTQQSKEPPRRPLFAVADAFAANKSLRLASLTLPMQPPETTDPGEQQERRHHVSVRRIQPTATQTTRATTRHTASSIASPLSRTAAHLRSNQGPSMVPLHDAIRSFDDAVDASPHAGSNQAAVTELFLADWLDRFGREKPLYKSIVVHAEIAFQELYRLTANIAFPNDLVAAFACTIFDDMTVHFGPYTQIMQVLSSELRQAIYAPALATVAPTAAPVEGGQPSATRESPYFAMVKHQKRILLSLRKDQVRRQERNDFLQYEIGKVHHTFRHFLDQCSVGLARSVFREWYSVAVVSKRNSKKYIEYFSGWFGGSAKSLVPRLFLAWKHQAIESKVSRMHEQLAKDHERLAGLQKQIDELSVQRDIAQVESLAIRNDRKQAEDTIQRLHRKIQSASAFLETSHRREPLVAHEGQLRAEAVSFLPALVLETLLRGCHNVGYLQPLHTEFMAAAPTTTSETATSIAGVDATASVLQQCLVAMQSHVAGGATAATSSSPPSSSNGLSLSACADFLQRIKTHIEDDPTAHMLFITAAAESSTQQQQQQNLPLPSSAAAGHEDVGGQAKATTQEAEEETQKATLLAALVHVFNEALRNVRHQDEHYARHAKLFSSRMLEPNEVSVVPHAFPSPSAAAFYQDQQHPPILLSSLGYEPLTFEAAADLGVINGVRRFSFLAISSGAAIATATQDPLHHQGDAATSSASEEQRVVRRSVSLDDLALLRCQDFTISPLHTNAFVVVALSQLICEYGSLLFSPTDMTAFVKNCVFQKVMLRGIAGGKHKLTATPKPTTDGGGGGGGGEGGDGGEGSSEDDNEDDDYDDSHEVGGGGARRRGRRKSSVRKSSRGGGKLHKQNSQRRLVVTAAPRRLSSYRGLHAPLAKGLYRALTHLVTAYDLWNKISRQLVDAEIVQARGITIPPDEPAAASGIGGAGGAAVGAVVPAVPGASASLPALIEAGAVATPSSSNGSSPGKRFLSGSSASAGILQTLRPRLHLHTEPLATGALMTAAKEKDRSDTATGAAAPTTPLSGGHRRSMESILIATEYSYSSSKVRLLSLDDTQQLTFAMKSLHEEIVQTNHRQRAAHFASAKKHVREIKWMQWHQACSLAGQFVHVAPATVETTTTTPLASTMAAAASAHSSPLEDDRCHVFECITMENDAIQRLFSVEQQPYEELTRVHQILERKKHVVRHALYSKYSSGLRHATSLEELWHVVKLVRLPKDVRVLPPMRDEELLGSAFYNEQLFSPDDLAEVVLQLCNEQFSPHISPLSARVDHFVTHHLPLAVQNQSALREIVHKTDVKKALADHSQTLRTVFRRYCAKEKELAAAAAAKRRAAVVAAVGSTHSSSSTTGGHTMGSSVATAAATATGSGGSGSGSGGGAPVGLTKFMRLCDWHEFIGDYKLLRGRFTCEYATTVFRQVQEAESGLEDHLEMIYGEFCDAVVALAVCFFPDPFLRHSTRVNQFIRRFLPVSPDEIRDHH